MLEKAARAKDAATIANLYSEDATQSDASIKMCVDIFNMNS